MIEHGQVWEDRGEQGLAARRRLARAARGPRRRRVRALLAAGHVVVAAGGGGIPVVRDADGRLRGVEAVIDKDLTAALLARTLDADVLVIATDVDHAAVDWGTPQQRELGRVTLAEMRGHAAAGQFASGSMGPKVEAATRFVEGGGPRSVITSLTHITDAVEGGFGTVIEPD